MKASSSTAGALDSGVSTPGLRERRRQQTRADISEAALRLFEERGLEATTVDGIAEASGVSPRTFFRYFSSKEEAALPVHTDFDAAVEAGVADVDAGRPPRGELERIYADTLTGYADNASDPAKLMLRVARVIRREPQLRASFIRYSVARTESLTRALAAAYGMEATDLRIRLAVDLSVALVRAALDAWEDRLSHGADVTLPAVYDEARRLAHAARDTHSSTR